MTPASKTESIEPRIQIEHFLGNSFKLETSGHNFADVVSNKPDMVDGRFNLHHNRFL